jgi:hypothetical protein
MQRCAHDNLLEEKVWSKGLGKDARLLMGYAPIASQFVSLFSQLLQCVHKILEGRPFVDVVDVDIANDSLFVDDKQGPFRNTV